MRSHLVILAAVLILGEAEDQSWSDCVKQRTAAIQSLYIKHRQPKYVPRCTDDGQYQMIQTNDFTGMSWCVDVTTGAWIEGTVTRGVPNCDDPQGNEPVCPGDSKYHVCSPFLCAEKGHWRSDGDVVCRINPCDGCKAEVPGNWSVTPNLTPCQEALLASEKYFWTKSSNMYRWFVDVWFDGSWTSTTWQSGPAGPTTIRPIQDPARRPSAPPGFRGDMGQPGSPPGEERQPRPPQAESRVRDYVMGVSWPMCTTSGQYEDKQCHGDVCWCVNATGSAFDLSMTIGDLTCLENGKDPHNSPGNPVECASGVTPEPCPHACLGARCNHPNLNLVCKADMCNQCQVSFFDEDGNEVECLEDDDCEWVPDSLWYVDTETWQCTNRDMGDNCSTTKLYQSKDACIMSDMFPVSANCLDKCAMAMCPGNIDAVCVVDYSQCNSHFVDISTGQWVDCDKVAGVCLRDNAREIKWMWSDPAAVVNGWVCDEQGNYAPTQCRDAAATECYCVEVNGKPISDKVHYLEENEKLHCEQMTPLSISGTVTFTSNLDVIRANLTAFASAFIEAFSEMAMLSRDNVMATGVDDGYDVYLDLYYKVYFYASDEAAVGAAVAGMSNFDREVQDNDYAVPYGNVSLPVASASYELDYVQDSWNTTDEWSDGEEEGFPVGYIALIFIFALLFVALVLFICACRRRSEQKKSEWVGSSPTSVPIQHAVLPDEMGDGTYKAFVRYETSQA